MHRFYLPPEQCSGQEFTLDEREAHHGLRVLRLRVGEEATVLDGAGQELRCTVSELARRSIRLQLTERIVHPPPLPIHLLQATPKGKAFDWLLQKAAELGAYRIVPLQTERVVAQVDEKDALSKQEKWRATLIEAIKQSGNPWLPRLEPPISLAAFLSRNEACDLSLAASLAPGSSHPRRYFDEFFSRHGRPPASVALWVGPEGDFTPAELQAILASGARPISLGPLVLRSETAALWCITMAGYELRATGETSK